MALSSFFRLFQLLLVSLFLFFTGTHSGVISSTFTTTQTGDATFYGPTTGGNCGYGTLYPPFVTSSVTKIALNNPQYIGNGVSQGCGMCISYYSIDTRTSSPISKTAKTAFVHDKCPECLSGSIDLSISGDGRWKVAWKAIACPVGTTKLHYKFQGSNPFYLKVQVVGHSVPIQRLRFVIGKSNYTAVRTDDNFFVSPGSGAPTPFTFPLKVEVTSIFNQVVTDYIPYLPSNQNVLIQGTLKVQFTKATFVVGEELTIFHNIDGSLNTTLVVGVAVGCAVGLIALISLVVVVRKRKQAANVEMP